MKLFSRLLILIVTILVTAPVRAKTDLQEPAPATQQGSGEERSDPMSASTFTGLRLRLVGPAFTSGRIGDLAVDPTNRSIYYLAVSSGGVWKTTNNGTTFSPIFDREGSYSIAVVALDPRNPLTVWVGTGENNSQRSVSYGDGVYRSDDGGKTWRNMGLKNSEHIGRIVIDPRDSNTVYVASQGPLWSAGGDRGLYKTTDGGKTWKAILSISENTGVTDLVMDPKDPDTLYAAAYQRRRHVWTLINGGPESAIYKSTDAGATWNKLRAGLPAVELGRVGLAISPVDPNVIYATIEAADRRGGIFRSTDRGGSWERRNEFESTALYYARIFTDPKEVDRIYVMNVNIMVSDDGGRTVRRLGQRNKHVDDHVIWIDPSDTSHYLVGCDGGLYESFDRAATWQFKENIPITQFYNVSVDNAAPFYNVFGGTQDNFSVSGPSRTRSASGITNGDWFVTQGGDGFRTQVDPEDPNIIYSESQYGVLVRFDKRTGERMGIQPLEGEDEEPYRWNWDSPLIISPHSRTRLYFAANRLFRSDDRGDSWRTISGELSRGLDRDKLPVMGKVWGADAVSKHASTSFFGNATSLSESPKQEGLIYVGTDDGLIQVTENGGRSWRKIEKFSEVPDMTYVSRIAASVHQPATVYATFDNHKNGDFAPYILKSTDAGQTWKSIRSNLPARGSVLAIAEDHLNPDLLFLGTEFGLFFTIDGGQKWIQLRGGLPIIAVRDLVIQKRENDLVVGTFGRGIYILDDYTPLRAIKPATLQSPSMLFPVKDALMYIQSQPLGGRGKGMQGETFYTADNPPFGATFTYYLKDSFKTKKQLRQEAERRNPNSPYPTRDQLRAEDEDEPSSLVFTVADSTGAVVRRMTAPGTAGVHRITWDLRYPAASLAQRTATQEEDSGEGPSGPLVMPGRYSVSVSRMDKGVATRLTESQTFNIVVEGHSSMSPQDRAALVEFQKNVAKLQRAANGTLEAANGVRSRLALIKRAILETPSAEASLSSDAISIDNRANEILRVLRGDPSLRGRNENMAPTLMERIGNIVGQQRMSTSKPTQTQINQFSIASARLEEVSARLRTLVDNDLTRLERALDAAGAPWTPGRVPVWRGN